MQSVQPQQQFHMSASASAGAGANTQRQVPLWANTQTTLADVDPTLSGLESMAQTRPHVRGDGMRGWEEGVY